MTDDFEYDDQFQEPVSKPLRPEFDYFAGEILPAVVPPEEVRFIRPIFDGTTTAWPALLTFELALGINSLDTILNKYNLSREEYDYISQLPAFRKELVSHVNNIEKNGLTFKIKAAAQAESYLEVLDEIVHNASNPVSTRLDAIKSSVKWGGLEPKEEKEGNQNNTQFNIQIVF